VDRRGGGDSQHRRKGEHQEDRQRGAIERSHYRGKHGPYPSFGFAAVQLVRWDGHPVPMSKVNIRASISDQINIE
jgi:hypothetical protein